MTAFHLFEGKDAPGEFMQQRRVRLGDILDDYCPRERRITNHAVVAMIDDEVKQTRCTTCQSDHEYKEGKAPPPRRKKPGALSGEAGEGVIRPRAAAAPDDEPESLSGEEPQTELEPETELVAAPDEPIEQASEPDAGAGAEAENEPSDEREEWPVHRPLIRATLPRPEGQTPERKAPDFTFRPGGDGRFDTNRNHGKRHRGNRPMRHGQGGGGPRQGQGSGQGPQGQGRGPQGQRHGNRPGPGGGGRPGGQGGGRKRGR
jgi:hypothetical protein